MVDGYYSTVIKELKKLGFGYSKNAKGSHEKWKHKGTGFLVLVPRNLYRRHTANGILKAAGSKKKL